MKLLRYIELKSGYSDNGLAWIGYVTTSKTGRTLYFNGRGFMKLKGQRRGELGGNYIDMETGESFWISGVKKNREDRHWFGSGNILVEADAVSDYLKEIGAESLDKSRHEITNSIRKPTSRGSRNWPMLLGRVGATNQMTHIHFYAMGPAQLQLGTE